MSLILGTVSIICIVGLLAVAFRKIQNVSIHKGEKRDTLMVLLEFSLSLIFLLFLFFVQFTTAFAASQDEILLPEAFEASQYLLFASFMVIVIFFLMIMEILLHFKFLTSRGRMIVEK